MNTPSPFAAAAFPHPSWIDRAKPTPELLAQLADEHDNAPLYDPAIVPSYEVFIDAIVYQFHDLLRAGLTVTFHSGEHEYPNSAAMVADVEDNRHLWVYRTDDMGNPDHPLWQYAGEHNRQPVVFNDLFRAVHDFLAHAATGYTFGVVGEYRAYLAHKATLPAAAHAALAIETVYQNAWVNTRGAHLPPAERPYAVQKVFYPAIIP